MTPHEPSPPPQQQSLKRTTTLRRRMLVAAGATTLIATYIGLRALSFRTALHLTQRLQSACLTRFQAHVGASRRHGGDAAATNTVSAQMVGLAVNAAARRLPFSVTCLPRAFATYLLLASFGYDSELKIGVLLSDTSSRLAAHAWIERDAEVIVGAVPNLAAFHPLPAIGREIAR